MEDADRSGGGARGGVREGGADVGRPAVRRPAGFPGQVALRVGFYLSVLALVLIRFWLDPSAHLSTVFILVVWYLTAAIYFALRAGALGSGSLGLVIRFVFHVYEVTAVVVVLHYIGGSGWLAILMLLYPVTEMHLVHPGRVGLAGSAIAIVVCVAMAGAEALGWLGHDPFYSVADPLYRQPQYVLAVLIVSCLALLAPAAAQPRSRS